MEAAQQSVWKNRDFTKLFVSYTLSGLGDWLDMIAIMVLVVYIWNIEPFYVSLIPVLFALPGVLFSQFAGVLADRKNKLSIMMTTDLLRMLLTVALIFSPNVYLLFAILPLRAAAGVFNGPAFQAMNRQIVRDDQLLQATSYTTMAFQGTKIIGPLAGGLLAASFSPKICLLLNAVTFLVSALILFTISKQKKEIPVIEKKQKETTLFEDWKNGWSILLNHRILLASFLYFAFGFFAIHFVESQTNVLIREVAPDRPSLLGWSVSLFGLGTILVASRLKRVQNAHRYYGWLLGGGLIFLGVYFLWMAQLQLHAKSIWILIPSFIGGLGVGLTFIGFNFLIRRETPKETIGRVFGIIQSVTSLTMIAAPLTGGALVQFFGVGFTMQIVGCIILVFGLGGILLRKAIWGTQVSVQDSMINTLQNKGN